MKRNCDNCGKEYEADKRNVNRGWGLCCSKSCAAQKREKDRTSGEPTITNKMDHIQHYQTLLSYLQSPDQEALKLSMDNVHGDGVFSLVIKGTEFGKLTRVFIAKKKLVPYQVQLHTHRYGIRLTVLNGIIRHQIARFSQNSETTMSLYKYHSPLNGGQGLTYEKEARVKLSEYHLPVGSVVDLEHTDFHTMAVSKDSVWVVEEQGFMEDHSWVLGMPFVTEGLYTQAQQFQINDACQLVRRHLSTIINTYQQ